MTLALPFRSYFEACLTGLICAVWWADAVQYPLAQLLDWMVR